MAKRIKVVEKRLRKHGGKKVYGQAHENGLVEIDPRQDSIEYLDTLVHEILHIKFPKLTEKEVIQISNDITNAIWGQNFRKIQD